MIANKVMPSAFTRGVAYAMKPLLRIAPRLITKVANAIGSVMQAPVVSLGVEGILGRSYYFGGARMLYLHRALQQRGEIIDKANCIVFIPSAKGINDEINELIYIYNQASKKVCLCVVVGREGKRVTISNGSQKVVFRSCYELEKIDNEIDKLIQVYNLITELNMIIPSNPIERVIVTIKNEQWGKYYPIEHKIGISLSPYFLQTTAHEMGHAIFRVLLGGKVELCEDKIPIKDKLWQRIWCLQFGSRNTEIIRDSNYVESANTGHPNENPTELFASSLMVYRMYPDKFIDNILTPNARKEIRKFGKLIFLYLRDKIFKGKVFSKSDPFKKEKLDKVQDKEVFDVFSQILRNKKSFWVYGRFIVAAERANIDMSALINPIIIALDSESEPDPGIRRNAAMTIKDFPLKAKRFIMPLIRALNDENPDVCCAAAEAIGELGIRDERYTKPLIEALNGADSNVCHAVAKTIINLKLKDERFVGSLTDTVRNGKLEHRRVAALALGETGNKEAIPALREMSDHWFGALSQPAKAAIRKIEKRETGISNA